MAMAMAMATAMLIQFGMKAGLVKEGATLVKLVGNFKIKQALSVKVNVSNGAKKCIEAAGGKIEE
jgi:ribosomal protein L15